MATVGWGRVALAAVTLGAASVVAVGDGRRAEAQAPAVVATTGADVKQRVAKMKGKALLVNVWATWCIPCVKEFPDLVKLHNTYKGRGFSVVGLSLDEPDEKAKVQSFLTRQKSSFPNFIARSGDPASIVLGLDPRFAGQAPTTYLFNKQGRQVGKPIVGKKSYEEWVALITPLL